MECGDNVIIINAEKVRLTGRKGERERFYWHTGHPGGIKERTLDEIRRRKPENLVLNAVRRMIPRTPLGRQQMRNLRVYAGAAHPHEAQQPEVLNVAAMNPKNARSR
jgi:large subunit ribosomal protein L13